MAEIRPTSQVATPASFVLGHKLDGIPFSGYHIAIIAVLALVGFIEGYDLVITGSLLTVIPIMAAFLYMQRYWRSGLATGSVKA